MNQYEINNIYDKEGACVSIPQWEALAQFSFIPKLTFASDALRGKIQKKIKKLHEKGKLSREQLWFGSYYREEILGSKGLSVDIRWIDRKMGWGVFAAKDCRTMAFVAEYQGSLRACRRSDRENAYCFEFALAPDFRTSYNIDAERQGGVSRFINHSSEPNLRSALATVDGMNHVILVAQRPIVRGEQLFYDYGPDYWAHRKISH